MNKRTALSCLILVSLILGGCSANKYLAEGEKFYEGAEIKYVKKKNLEDDAEINREIERLLRPDPNSKLLGSRPRPWFYGLAGEVEKEKGFKHWVKTKLGRKPVLISDVDISRSKMQIESTLKNNGYFGARVISEVKESKHASEVHYTANISAPFRYDTIHFDISDSVLSDKISRLKTDTQIKPGDRYDLDNLKAERLRLEKALKDQGYYHFSNEYLLFRADSTVGDKQVEMFLNLKSTTPNDAKAVYNIKKVNLFTNYTYKSDSTLNSDTTIANDINFVQPHDDFRPEIITEQVAVRPGEVYSKENELITLNRLIQLDVFKYVNIDYEEDGNALDANIYVSPYKKKSIRLELQAVSKSNSFVGPNFTATFKNRNIFRGAESYELNLNAGYEVQVGGNAGNQPLNSYTIGLENVLTIPRIISPFNIRNRSSRFVPQTKIKLGFRTLKRIDFFTLNSIDAAYGFNWRETKTKRHELYPVDINFIQLGKVSQEFDSVLNVNPLLRRSYEEQFILGTTYSFYYNSQNDKDRESRSDLYFNGNIDLSGNLMHVAQSSVREEENTDENPYEILGSPYSQFVKADIDVRYYFQIAKRHRIATRLITGVGYAFGNSTTLPYTKQFSIGGSNSIRAFRARSVGPGEYQVSDSATFIDQTADIKLEANFEYRFPIIGAFRGALFTDAGNIWTLREDEQRPGGEFDPKNFVSQLAVGAGVGLRFDAEFFVLRFDLAFPVRIPTEDRGERWRFKDIAIGDKDWRKENLLLNIAIGYPF